MFDLLLWICFFFFYYKYCKSWIFQRSDRWVEASYFQKALSFHSRKEISGVLELGIASLSHFCFALFLILFWKIDFSQLGFEKSRFLDLFYGILLGIGEMSLSFLLSLGMIHLIDFFSKKREEKTDWQTASRGGWIQHHIHSLRILPFGLALLILFLQVGSEELIFRVIVPQSLEQNGWSPFYAIFFAILSFIGMQAFHTPSLQTALFPMIGALVMGVTHSILYYFYPVLPPLIIAHVTFFLFAVL